jgi:pilus assembly protein CpaB
MTRQTMIALGAAILLGLFAVYIANAFISRSETKAYQGATTKVAVAAVPLSYGVDLTADKVRFVDYPNSSIPPGAFTNAAQLLQPGKKRFALLPIAINEPILANKISAEGEGASISALLPEGMRAATVRINDVSGVAGFIQPNDRVDVLITRSIASGDRASTVTDVLLQNVRVIAMGTNAKSADGKPIPARTSTLEVAPLDAQKLALGEAAGTLSLVLRKPGEQNNPVVETVSMNDLRYNMYGGARYPSPAVVGAYGGGLGGAMAGAMQRTADEINAANSPRVHVGGRKVAKKAAPKKAAPSVEIYRGTTSNQYQVGGYGS